MGKSNTEQLKIAQKYLGQGGARFRSYCGLPSGAAWCDAFVTYIFNEAGNASLFCSGKKQTYCPTTIKICAKDMAQVPMYLAMPSDVIFFDWERNGVPNHIGFVRSKVSTDTINTTEGNTSNKVMNKTRPAKYVQAIYRPHFKGSYKLGTLAIDGNMEYSTIANLQKVLGGVPVDGILGIKTVKRIQAYFGASPQDGAWGPKTSKAIQSKLAKDGYYTGKIDSAFGPASVKGLQRFCNAKNTVTKPAPKPTPKPTPAKPTAPVVNKKPTTETRQKMKKIGHARCDYDHKAGDSSGKEVCLTKFTYNPSNSSVYDWTYVFRPKNVTKANKAATMCEKACANNAIGYTKNGETAYGKARAMTKLAAAVNYDLSKITTKCGLSCGDLICLCNRWAGLSKCYQGSGLGLAKSLKKNSNFECIPYKRGMQLYRGDTLITAHSNGKHNHVVMCV